MKVKNLKYFLNFLNEDSDIILSLGSLSGDLKAIDCHNGKIILTSNNYDCSDDEITLLTIIENQSK